MALGEHAGTVAETDHVSTCPDCSQEVSELARIADVGRSTTQTDTLVAPSPEVWRRICADLGLSDPHARPVAAAPVDDVASRASATVIDLAARRDRPVTPARLSAVRRFAALAVAALVALVVGVGVGISYEQRVVKPVTRVIASATLKALPKWSGATGTAQVTADGRGNRELVLHLSTSRPVDGTLHVWLMKNSVRDPQSMGVVRNGVARLSIPPGMSLFTFPVVDVSDEPPGDRNNTHSGDSVVRGQLA